MRMMPRAVLRVIGISMLLVAVVDSELKAAPLSMDTHMRNPTVTPLSDLSAGMCWCWPKLRGHRSVATRFEGEERCSAHGSFDLR